MRFGGPCHRCWAALAWAACRTAGPALLTACGRCQWVHQGVRKAQECLLTITVCPLHCCPQELLVRQLEGCQQQLDVVQWEHLYIKDQLTTTEVGAAAARAGGVAGCTGGLTLTEEAGPGRSARMCTVRLPRWRIWGAKAFPCAAHSLCVAAGVHGACLQLGCAAAASRGSLMRLQVARRLTHDSAQQRAVLDVSSCRPPAAPLPACRASCQ